MVDIKDVENNLNLAVLNWEICKDYLDDAIIELRECIDKLESTLGNIDEAKQN